MSDGDVNENNGQASRASSNSRRATKSTPDPAVTSSTPPKGSAAATGTNNNTLLVPPSLSLTAPTPEASPISPSRRIYHKSSPTPPTSVLQKPSPLSPPAPVQKSRSSASGKRKADEAGVDGATPPKEPREHRATFAPEPRTHRASATSSSSHAPTSFHRTKRARISLSSESQLSTRAANLTGDSPNAKSTGSWSSRTSHAQYASSSRPTSRPASRQASTKELVNTAFNPPRRSASRRSISNHSIPMSAYMSPHAPSVTPSGTFHMRDPRKPARIQDTPWALALPGPVEEGEPRSISSWPERGGSPLHAWLFYIGFIIFPLWWIAGFLIPIIKTRRLEAGDAEKGVILDDPQVEHDYKSWRRRCRIMSGVSILTYIPFIVLIAVFA